MVGRKGKERGKWEEREGWEREKWLSLTKVCLWGEVEQN